jgi:3-oxoacyl-[acyl-carrier-protein] synthase-3
VAGYARAQFASAAPVAQLVTVAVSAPTNGAAPIDGTPGYELDRAAVGRTLRGAAIASVGASLPDTVVSSEQIAENFGVDADWIVRRTGIRARRFASAGERLSTHAARAAARALEQAHVHPAEVDLVVVATTTADELMPNAAPLVAAEIGARGAGAFDVGAACTGFLYALALGCAQIESRRAGGVVVVGADFMSRITDPGDRATASLFGDGAGAVALLPTDEPGRIGPVVLGSDGEGADKIIVRGAPATIHMQGQDTFREAVDRLSWATLEAARAAGVPLDEIDLFVYHQANRRILQAIGERLALEPERVVDCIGEQGNTSAASVPLALAYSDERDRLHAGDRVLLGSFGAGMTWGATVVEWGA